MPNKSKLKVFISYRRGDTAWVARLIKHIIENQTYHDDIVVFLDLDSLDTGERFPLRLEREILMADAVLALVGSRWEAKRLHEPTCFLRRELATAIKNKVLVMPLLVEADPPHNFHKIPKEELPEELSKLGELNHKIIHVTESIEENLRLLIQHLSENPINWNERITNVSDVSNLRQRPRFFGRFDDVDQITQAITGSSSYPVIVVGRPGAGVFRAILTAFYEQSVFSKFVHRRISIDASNFRNAAHIVDTICEKMNIPLRTAPALDSKRMLRHEMEKAPCLIHLSRIDGLLGPQGLSKDTDEILCYIANTANVRLVLSARDSFLMSCDSLQIPVDPLSPEECSELFLRFARSKPTDAEAHLLHKLTGGSPREVVRIAGEIRPHRKPLAAILEAAANKNPRNEVVEREMQDTGLVRLLNLLTSLPNGLSESMAACLPEEISSHADQLVEKSLARSENGRLFINPESEQNIERQGVLASEDLRMIARSVADSISSFDFSAIPADLETVEWLFRPVLASCETPHADIRKVARAALAIFEHFRRTRSRFPDVYEVAMEAAARIGDVELGAQCRLKRGWFYHWRAGLDDAAEERATQDFQAIRDAAIPDSGACRAEALYGLGDVERTRGNFEPAIAFLTSAIEQYEATDLTPSEVQRTVRWVKMHLGDVRFARLELDEAERLYHEALNEASKSPSLTGFCTKRLGDVARIKGKWADAERYYSAVIAIRAPEDSVGLERTRVAARVGRAFARWGGKKFAEVEQDLKCVLPDLESLNSSLGLAHAKTGLAMLALNAGDDGTIAGPLFKCADTLLKNDRGFEAALLKQGRRELAIRQGDAASAERLGIERDEIVQSLPEVGRKWIWGSLSRLSGLDRERKHLIKAAKA